MFSPLPFSGLVELVCIDIYVYVSIIPNKEAEMSIYSKAALGCDAVALWFPRRPNCTVFFQVVVVSCLNNGIGLVISRLS